MPFISILRCSILAGGNVEIQVRKDVSRNVQVISMRGDLMVGDAVDNLRRTVTQTLGSGNSRIVFDLSDVKLLDSSGIGVLVRTLTAVKQRGGNAKLVNPSEYA